MSDWTKNLLDMASMARSSELHDLKCGLEPNEADEIAKELERLTTENAALRERSVIMEKFGKPSHVAEIQKLQAENAALREALTEIEGSSETSAQAWPRLAVYGRRGENDGVFQVRILRENGQHR